MKAQHRFWPLLVGLGLGLAAVGLTITLATAGSATQPTGSVSGVVRDAGGPISGATVRIRATQNVTSTAADGSFTLDALTEGEAVEVTAWYDGYYVASQVLTPTLAGVILTLRPYHTIDNPDYQWVDPTAGSSDGACGNCHPMIVSQWITNAHGGGISNPRFYSLYNGTDITGTTPVSPGYLDDFPNTAGHCANCHAPGVGIDNYMSTDMNAVRDVITAGIHCDLCHKVGGVYLNSATNSVYHNVPGVQSQRMLRPPAGDNIFFGPYDDIHDPDTYLPMISESQFCAPCHQFSMWGTPIYESYEEWLTSPFAEQGVTCQNCHMPPNGDTYFVLPEKGGLPHPPETIPSHQQLGATSLELQQNTVSITLSAQHNAGQIQVTVTLTNTGAGHHVPTDFPGRQMLLVITATNGSGQALTLLQGDTIPDWGGDQAGRPGKAYAKILKDVLSGQSPVVSYWKQTLIVSDNRLPALQSDVSTYTFSAPAGGETAVISAELRFRRAFQEVMEAKGWNTPDIIMEYSQISLPIPIGQSSPYSAE